MPIRPFPGPHLPLVDAGKSFLAQWWREYLFSLDLWARGRSAASTYNPPNLGSGDGTTTTISVKGAVVGDFVTVSFSQDLQGITLTAWVSADDTVSVRFQNGTGGAINLASGTLKVQVRKD